MMRVLVPLTAGFKLPCQLHQVVVARFADDDLIIDFDNFVRCLVRLETLFSKWLAGWGTTMSVLWVLKQPDPTGVKSPEPETCLSS